MLAKAAAVSQFPGFSRWAFGQQHEHAGNAVPPPRVANYQPSYFSASEYRTIDILTGLIIPPDESPGAQEAGVSEFIDFLAAHGEEEIRQPMRDGLKWLDATAKKSHGAGFAGLSLERQTEILKRVAYRDSPAQGDIEGRAFFRLIRRYTVMGYYTSRAGLSELDYPGLRLYTESPACPHTGDPEHRRLPPPRV
ncbi:MAG TPA: gluconate 2-dehydrogenase subunit 3 family protein [Bryobacteraceae bacterium]|nr:gluconate 2-dehydrogenase subunit 3 family protein [Bryobacteraceae bacterium]